MNLLNWEAIISFCKTFAGRIHVFATHMLRKSIKHEYV